MAASVACSSRTILPARKRSWGSCSPSQPCLVSLQPLLRHNIRCGAGLYEGSSSSGENEDMAKAAARLNQLLQVKTMDARELRQLVLDKWGRSYDIRLHRRANKMYLQVMWKFLEQQSFHLTEDEYMQQLDAVASYINDWGVSDTVRQGIRTAKARGPGYTGGNGARCISIPLDVDLSGSRSAEWD